MTPADIGRAGFADRIVETLRQCLQPRRAMRGSHNERHARQAMGATAVASQATFPTCTCMPRSRARFQAACFQASVSIGLVKSFEPESWPIFSQPFSIAIALANLRNHTLTHQHLSPRYRVIRDLQRAFSHKGEGSMEDDQPTSYSRRRTLLLAQGALVAAAPAAGVLGFISEAAAQTGDQTDWRFCNKCMSMFWNGNPNKGRCPAGGGHVAQGFIFNLHYDSNKAPTPQKIQYDWRFCNKCMSMFWDGNPNKGRCPAGGGHNAQGFNFGLNFEPIPGQHQRDWRFCDKCMSLFWDGNPNKGRCPAGGGHHAQGFNFHLPFRHPSTDPAQAISDVLLEFFDVARGELEKFIKAEIGKPDLIAHGVSLYDINFRLGRADFRAARTSFNYSLLDTYLYFKSTTPSVFGSYADPAFEVHTDATFRGTIVLPPQRKPHIENVNVAVTRITIKPRNVTGGIATTMIAAFKLTGVGGRIIQQAHERLNQELTKRVNDYLERF